jgi:hypothetical protein
VGGKAEISLIKRMLELQLRIMREVKNSFPAMCAPFSRTGAGNTMYGGGAKI